MNYTELAIVYDPFALFYRFIIITYLQKNRKKNMTLSGTTCKLSAFSLKYLSGGFKRTNF